MAAAAKAFVFELPEVGEGVLEAEVASWNVAEGDVVSVDQLLCEIVTDKAQLEITSPKAGKILKLHGVPGDIIKVHAPLVEFDLSAAGAPSTAAPPTAPAVASPIPAVAPPPAPPRAPSPIPSATPTPQGPTKATPAIRREARERGIDIQAVSGTGHRGRVTRGDLETFDLAPAPTLPSALPQSQAIPSGAEERIKILGIRRAIAEQMTRSKHTAAHFTYVEEVDCAELVDLRKRMKRAAADRGIKITYIPIIMKAVSLVLRDFPNVNAVMDEERFELVVKGDHDFGISTDTPNGLYVPVIRNVEQKSILQVAQEMAELTERTRQGRARLDELRGGTFTFTSVGAIGGVLATPILNVPQVAILGINAIRDQAVVRGGEIVVRPMMYLSPSFDHRVIDGAVGARFVAALKQVLEHPEMLLMELR